MSTIVQLTLDLEGHALRTLARLPVSQIDVDAYQR